MPRERVERVGKPYTNWQEEYGDLEPYRNHPLYLEDEKSLSQLRRDPRIGLPSKEEADHYGRCGAELESGWFCGKPPRAADTEDGGDKCWEHSDRS